MSCSSARYTSHIQKLLKNKNKVKKDTIFVIGQSKKIGYDMHTIY